ncbi:MAG TPA: tail fiber domain-containing protein [Thermoanaerobaculia bacterium]|nr:tail fiber domain-containing protein [Thermoanaerobaculia bacterium]HUM31309.1 tail fiber domain-containing protein [Thermoanaerobaculia bacterium]HXK69663.1 tail fiber domain-containing protein [Thermoanaerobaculia bacterium]
MKKVIFFCLICAFGFGFIYAANPPGLINYEGILRDDTGAPLDGSYDMVFSFFTDAAAGEEILIDSHLAAGTGAVTVSGGLFNVALGSGTVADGSGSGTYTTLGAVFANYDSVWLQVNVGGENLSPRIRVLASSYAQNARSLQGVVNVDTSGRVGIGTATPSADMHIMDDGNPTLILDDTLNTNQTRMQYAYAGTPAWSAGVQGGDAMKYKIASSDDLSLNTRLTIQTDGKVGIGTEDPGYLLDVDGDIRTTGSLRDSAGDGGTSGQVLSSTGSGIDWVDPASVNDGDWTISEMNLYNTQLGSVGIGTTTPERKLHVSGDLLVETYGSEILDQEQSLIPSQWSNNVAWQSFTAGMDGILSSIAVQLRSPFSDNSDCPTIVRIYSGEGASGALLSSQTITLSGGFSWRKISLAVPVSVTSGNQYTIWIDPEANERAWILCSGGDPYPGGRLNYAADWDATFRTYIGGGLSPAFLVTDQNRAGIGTDNPTSNLHMLSSTTNDGLTLQVTDNTYSQGLMFQNSGGAYTWRMYRKDVGSNHADLVFANGADSDLSALMDVVTFEHGGQVGIGNSDPSYALDVTGDIRTTGSLRDAAGDAGTSGQILSSTGSGIDWINPSTVEIDPQVNTLTSGKWCMSPDGIVVDCTSDLPDDGDWTISGSDMYSSVSGKVGIGTSTPANKMDVEGGMAIGATYSGSSAAPNNGLIVQGNVGIATDSPASKLDVRGSVRAGTATEYVEMEHGGSNGYINSVGDGNLDLRHDSNTLVSLTDVGNLGVMTSSPDTDLHIFSQETNQGLTLQVSDNTFNQGIRFKNSGNSYTWHIYRKDSGSNHANLVFANGAETDIAALTDVVAFEDGGNVLIGAMSASARLTVKDSLAVKTVIGDTLVLNQEDGTWNSQWTGGVLWQSWTNGFPDAYWTVVTLDCRSPVSGSAGSVTLRFYEGEGTGGTLLTQQTVTIPDSFEWHSFTIMDPPALTPGTKYTVAMVPASRDQYYWRSDSGNPYSGGTNNADVTEDFRFRIYLGLSTGVGFKVNENGSVGVRTENTQGYTLAVNGTAAKVGGGNWSTYSDMDLKKVEDPFTRGLADIVSLNPYYYQFDKDNPLHLPSDGKWVGPLAQEVLAYIPEAVETGTSGYYLVNNEPIFWAMVNAIKELDQRTGGRSAAQNRAVERDESKVHEQAAEDLEESKTERTDRETGAERMLDRRLVEEMLVAYPVEAGDVLVFNPANGEELYPCSLEADPMVLGVAAESGSGTVMTVVSGITLVKADASIAPIRRGDLLVSSPILGHAMKAQPTMVDGFPMYRSGTLIGKAVDTLDAGTGMIRVLVMIR